MPALASCTRIWWERPWEPELPRYLHRVRAPTLLVWGDEDRLIPVEQAETWRGLIPNAEVKIFPGAGHLVLDEKPEAVDAVTRFLA